MQIAVRAVQIIVAVLFIISGLVKANDPLGLSYKMQEFFELWNGELNTGGFFAKKLFISLFDFFHSSSLALSVFIIALEIVAGVALLVAWKRNFILPLLLLLILFFTFLTGYAYLSGKFTNCGCFGDCLPITPLASFGKDIALLLMIIFLMLGKKYLFSIAAPNKKWIWPTAAILISAGLQMFALLHLPPVDCLPFKKGASLPLAMKPPAGSVPDSFAIRFIYEKGGKQFEFAPEQLPSDFATYKFIDRKDKLIRKGNAEPAIKGFSLSGITGEDSTQIIMTQPMAVLVFVHDFSQKKIVEIKKLAEATTSRNLSLYVASYATDKAAKLLNQNKIVGVQLFNTDFTIVRTAARTNPTVYILRNGIVHKKYAAVNIEEAADYIQSPTSK